MNFNDVRWFAGRLPVKAAVLGIGLAAAPFQQAVSVTTGLDFAGGCPESEQNVGLCDQGGNADAQNVAAILGVDVSLVTQIGEIVMPDPPEGFDGMGPGFDVSVDDFDATSGTWSVSDPSITHLAFKADGYFILAEVTAGSGDVMMDPTNWDLSLATCPDTICSDGSRDYVEADFLNNGGQVADISNVRAFSVVPVPAAVWLFGSGLIGLVGIARRKRNR